MVRLSTGAPGRRYRLNLLDIPPLLCLIMHVTNDGGKNVNGISMDAAVARDNAPAHGAS